jgi:AraC-like DNA-binding protein
MPHYSRLSSARDYLAARFNERTSLADAAAHAGLSPFYFHRLFAQAFGETPHEFVTRLRMEHAKKLLLAGNHSVTDICLDACYDSMQATKAWGRSVLAFIPSPVSRQRPSGASRGECSEHPAGIGRFTTCPPASKISSPGFRSDRKIREVFSSRSFYDGSMIQRLSWMVRTSSPTSLPL